MDEPIQATRRSILIALLGSLPLNCRTADAKTRSLNDLSRVMPYTLEAARAIGGAYLRMRAEEASVAFLEEQLWSSIGVRRTSTASDYHRLTRDRLRHAMTERIQQDFAVGAMVSVKGWMLARTEARLCALIALTDT